MYIVINHKKIKECFLNAFSNSVKLISIKADSGKGKSSLIYNFIDHCERENRLYALIDFKNTISINNANEIMLDIINQLGKRYFPTYISTHNTFINRNNNTIAIQNIKLFASEFGNINANNLENEKRINETLTQSFIDDLSILCKEKSVTLFFDTYEKNNEEVSKWIERHLLYPNIRNINDILVVIAGQRIPDVNYYLKYNIQFDLPNGLKIEDWHEYASELKIDISLFEVINKYFHRFNGDPFYMGLTLWPLRGIQDG